MAKIKVFLIKSKLQYHLSQWRECAYGAQSWKERRLLCEFMIVQINEPILSLKMAEKEVFLMKPEHQYHLSHLGECVYGAQSRKERDYYVNSCLSQLTDELWF